jgi:phage shock protein PspC (stress-responsive transcriptional regulator)
LNTFVRMKRLKIFIEENAFGVCTFLGERLGIAGNYIRLFFIYVTFISPTSPLVIYFILAFWLNMKKYINEGRKFFSD